MNQEAAFIGLNSLGIIIALVIIVGFLYDILCRVKSFLEKKEKKDIKLEGKIDMLLTFIARKEK